MAATRAVLARLHAEYPGTPTHHPCERCLVLANLGAMPGRSPREIELSDYASVRRIFWILDNGSSHRGRRSVDRLQGR
jgi:hypothetical protein